MPAKRLLIVDDEPKFAAFVERVAVMMGYNVEVTHHGDDFKRAYLDSPPDVVVIDMVMPDIDGNELILWLVNKQCAAKIIIITGFHPDYAINARLLAEYKGLKPVTTLSKPINISKLRDVLASDHQVNDASPST